MNGHESCTKNTLISLHEDYALMLTLQEELRQSISVLPRLFPQEKSFFGFIRGFANSHTALLKDEEARIDRVLKHPHARAALKALYSHYKELLKETKPETHLLLQEIIQEEQMLLTMISFQKAHLERWREL